MTYCEHCGEKIDYLPFKCKYCGGNFCQQHRLPENHDCSFEMRHPFKLGQPQTDSEKKPLNLKKYLKRQEKLIAESKKKPSFRNNDINGPKILLIFILLASIIGSILYLFQFEGFIYFNISSLITNYTYYTIFTSLFVTVISLNNPLVVIDLLLLAIVLYFTYILSKSIDFRFGTKFLFKLYLVSALFSLVFFIFLRLTLIYIYPIPDSSYLFSIGFAWGGILGLISYPLFPAMNREVTALMTIIPIRLRARSFLCCIILFRIIPILFGPPYSFVFYLPDLGGILGAYLLYKSQLKYHN